MPPLWLFEGIQRRRSSSAPDALLLEGVNGAALSNSASPELQLRFGELDNCNKKNGCGTGESSNTIENRHVRCNSVSSVTSIKSILKPKKGSRWSDTISLPGGSSSSSYNNNNNNLNSHRYSNHKKHVSWNEGELFSHHSRNNSINTASTINSDDDTNTALLQLQLQQQAAVASQNASSSSSSLDTLYQLLQESIQENGPQHPLTGLAYNHLGNWYFRQSDYPNACQCYQYAAYSCQFSAQQTPDALANLGTIYWVTGDLPHAQMALLQSLDSSSRSGRMCPVTASPATLLAIANVYHQLGLVHSLQGDFTNAISALYQAMMIREQQADRFVVPDKKDDHHHGSPANSPPNGAASNKESPSSPPQAAGEKVDNNTVDELVAKTMNAMGQVCGLAGDWSSSVRWHQHAAKRFKTLGNLQALAKACVECALAAEAGQLPPEEEQGTAGNTAAFEYGAEDGECHPQQQQQQKQLDPVEFLKLAVRTYHEILHLQRRQCKTALLRKQPHAKRNAALQMGHTLKSLLVAYELLEKDEEVDMCREELFELAEYGGISLEELDHSIMTMTTTNAGAAAGQP